MPNQGLRVFLVRIDAKSWIRQKIIGGPLPDVADHLAATEGAVAGGMSADFDETAAAPIEIGVLRVGAMIAPRIIAALQAIASQLAVAVRQTRPLPIPLPWAGAARPNCKRLQLRYQLT